MNAPRIVAALAFVAAAQLAGATDTSPSANGPTRYRVTLDMVAAEDFDVVTRQLTEAYRARIELIGNAGTRAFFAVMSSQAANLLRADPRVTSVEEVVASPTLVSHVPSRDALSNPSSAPTPVSTAGPATWSTGAYTYDDSGNIWAIGSDRFSYFRRGPLRTGGAGTGRTQEYEYDAFGNLKKIITDEQTGAARVIGIDPLTNRASIGTGGANVWANYDTEGRITQVVAGDSFTWDALGMITKRQEGIVARVYLYTANDERIATINRATNAEEWTLRDSVGKVLRRLVKESIAGTARWTWLEDYVYRDDALLAAEVAGAHKRLQFHADHLGTPRLITSDGSSRVALHTYYPFGEEATAISQDMESRKFTGHERDATSLDYMHARYYNAVWGRFLSVDPGKDWDLHQPQSWNMYAYVRNNPIRNTDPTGRECGGCAAFERDVRELQAGKITVEEYNARLTARGVGAAVGALIVAGYFGGKALFDAAGAPDVEEAPGPSLEDPQSLRGQDAETVRQLIPSDWTSEPTNKGGGERFANPEKRGEGVRIMPGEAGARSPDHAGPYAIVTRNGEKTRVPLKGNPALEPPPKSFWDKVVDLFK